MADESAPNADVESTATDEGGHKPYVPASTILTELSFRAVSLGAVLGIVFAASSVYLALKVGLTVSASIPIAVLSITIFRAFGRATILENNIVQTTGSAGESIAAGVAFTLPALLLMGYDLEPGKVLLVALLGGLVGVLMMIPLRHGLIVKEHGKLTYPEGTACAEVLVVGEQGGMNARTVFSGFAIGAGYKLLSAGLHLWKEVPERALRFFRGASVGGEISPELLGVGYIIGPRVSATMLGGGVLGYLVIMPMIMLFGGSLHAPLYPAHDLIANMDPGDLRKNYVLYIGAGAVATGGLISLARAFPTIVSAFASGFRTFRASTGTKTAGAASEVPRTSRDLSMRVVLFGSLALVAAIWMAPPLQINLASAALIVLFGFFFVTVSSRITGEIGSSSNPISGMTVATLLITCLLFLAVGWTGVGYRAMALITAAIVCVAASNGGTTSQDLKTGYLVGATPRHQQVALLVGVVTSALVIGFTLILLNRAYTTVIPEEYPGSAVPIVTAEHTTGPDGVSYRVGYMRETGRSIPPGRYLVDESAHVHFVVDPGIGGRYSTVRPRADERTDETRTLEDGRSFHIGIVRRAGPNLPAGRYLVDDQRQIHFRLDGARTIPVEGRHVTKLTAPKAQLFSLIIDGILTRRLPWGLVLIGVMIALMMELCGVASLPFAVGLYLPLATSVPIAAGGAMRWLVDSRRRKRREREQAKNAPNDDESSPGTLLASGYIAGGAIAGLVTAALAGAGIDERFDLSRRFGFVARLAANDVWALSAFAVIAFVLFRVGARPEARKDT